MAKARPRKTDHLIPADRVGSAAKAGVWFGEQSKFKEIQGQILSGLKDDIDWIPLENAILAVSTEPPGLAIIAPNPSLPGIIVLADGATIKSTEVIQQRYAEKVAAVSDKLSVATYIGGTKAAE